jgi:probable F420-dependent oxidoreductase
MSTEKEAEGMEFGVVLQTDPPASSVVEFMRMADGGGFRYGWTFDSCVLWQEPFVIYSQILAATSSLVVGPMVTNPSTRDWSVTASLFATLNDMFGNRTVCGIGRGDSARRVIGQKPASLATLREAMHVIKELAEGREAIHHGTPVRIPWVRDGRLEIWMAAYGPKALSMVGQQADGFILQTADPAIARWTIGTVRAAARQAGRDPDEITMCVAAPAYVGEDLAAQRDQLRWFGGMVGNHVADLVARYGDSGAVPHALTATSRAGRAMTTPTTARQATGRRTSYRTRSSTASACSDPPRPIATGWPSWVRSVLTISRCT